jgi:hypothetical protein
MGEEHATLHHFIALFCTVAGKLWCASQASADFRNEINDLRDDLEAKLGQISF